MSLCPFRSWNDEVAREKLITKIFKLMSISDTHAVEWKTAWWFVHFWDDIRIVENGRGRKRDWNPFVSLLSFTIECCAVHKDERLKVYKYKQIHINEKRVTIRMTVYLLSECAPPCLIIKHEKEAVSYTKQGSINRQNICHFMFFICSSAHNCTGFFPSSLRSH